MRRWAGFAGLGLLGLTLATGCAGVGFGLWLRTDDGDRWLEEQVQVAVSGLLTEGSFHADDVDLSIFGRLSVRGLVLRSAADEELVVVPSLDLTFEPAALLSRRVRIDTLRADGVFVDLLSDDEGLMVLSRMFGGTAEVDPGAEPWGGLPIDLDLRDIDLRGVEVVMRTPEATTLRLAGVDVTGALVGEGKRFDVTHLEATALLVAPGPLPLSVRAPQVVYDDGALLFDDVHLVAPRTDLVLDGTAGDELDLTLTLSELGLATLDPLAGAPGLTGGLVGSARLVGSLDAAKAIVTLDGRDGLQGGVRLRVGADLTAEHPTWTVTGSVLPLHVDQALSSLTSPIVVQGEVEAGGTGLSWPDDFAATARFRGGTQELAGLSVSDVDLGARVEDGVVYLADDTRLRGIVGEVGATGWYDVQSGLVDIRATGTLEPEELAALGVTGLGRAGRFDARLLGDTASDNPLMVDGTVRYAPFVYQGDVVVSRVDVAYDVTIDGARVGGDLVLSGSGGEAYGVSLGSLQSTDLGFQLAEDGSVSASGRLEVNAIDLPGVFRTDQLATDVEVAVSEARTSVRAGLSVGPYALLDVPGSGGTGRVQLSDELVDFELGLDGSGSEHVYALGRFRTGPQTVDVAQLRYAPTPRIAWANDRPMHFRLTEHGGIADASVSLTSTLGEVDFEGQVGLSGPLDGVLTVEDLQLDMLAELFPDQADGLAGQASAVVRLHGTGEVPDIKATIDLRDLYLPEQVRYLDALGTVLWQGDALRPDLKLAVADQPFAALHGSLPLAGGLAAPAPDLDGPVDLTLDLRPSSFDQVAHLSPAVPAEQLPVGEYSAMVRMSGPLRQPVFHTAGVAELHVNGWVDPGRVEFDLVREGSSLSFWADLREGFSQRANLGGGGLTRFGEVWSWAVEGGEQPDMEDYTLWLDTMFVSGVLLGVPTRSLAAYAELGLALDGELVGGVSVSGSPMQPVVEGGLHWLDARVGTTKFDGAYLSLTPEGEGYQLDSQLTFPEGGGLSLAGPVPVRIDLAQPFETWSIDELGLAIGGDGVPLALLQIADPGIKRVTGIVDIEGAVGGQAHDPDPTLKVSMKGGSLQYLPLDLNLHDIDFELEADRRWVKVKRFEFLPEPRRKFRATGIGEIAGERPRVTMSGSARLEEWQPGAMSAQVRLRDGAWLAASDDLSLRADGDLQASGQWPALEVDGSLEVVYGKYVLDAATFIDTAPLQPDGRLTIARAAYERTEEEDEEELPPFYADFLVDVGVDLKRNLEVDVTMPFIDDLGSLGAAVTRLNATTRLGGGLTATVIDGQLDLVGEVDVLEGKVSVLRSNFDLEEGNVIFSGGDPFNPNLDLEAVMNITDATVTMTIAGTPEQPEIDFTSEQFPDQTQIMTILLTGQAPSDLGSDQGQGTAQALAGLLLNSIFAGQSLGSFSIEPDGSVKLGVPISQSIYANSMLAPTADATENRLTFGLEWSVLPRVVASGTVGDRTQSADLFWEIRF